MENGELFAQLSKTNLNDLVETKNKKKDKVEDLTYLSWAYAWGEFMKQCPDANYDILPYTYDEKLGYMVYTTVTCNGITRKMWLPVMDSKNKAMKDHKYQWQTKNSSGEVEPASMTDINKTYMRCLVKNIAMFGLGLYIYAGEDLPFIDEEEKEEIFDEPIANAKISKEQFEDLKKRFSADDLKNIQKVYNIEKFSEMSLETYKLITERKDFYG